MFKYGPSYVTEFGGFEEPVPENGDAYTSLEVLINFIAVMSVRYGLPRELVKRACTFLREKGIIQLNEHLQAGQTFLFVPTNHVRPRFLHHETSLQELRDPSLQILRGATGGTHGYPGLLLDIAAFVEAINEKLNDASAGST